MGRIIKLLKKNVTVEYIENKLKKHGFQYKRILGHGDADYFFIVDNAELKKKMDSFISALGYDTEYHALKIYVELEKDLKDIFN